MKDKHITEILDNASTSALSESELNEVRAHALECGSCRSAYEAARLSAVVLKSRAQVTIEPSPFFQTRVMAALREQQCGGERAGNVAACGNRRRCSFLRWRSPPPRSRSEFYIAGSTPQMIKRPPHIRPSQ
jgi:hypothetical protein